MNRTLFLLHRYLGIALGLLIAVWCLSGIVMMYAQYPELSAEQQAAILEPLNLESCCRFPDAIGAIADRPVESIGIEMMAGRPVMRLTFASRERRTIDLTAGRFVEPLDRAEADRVAEGFAAVTGIGNFDAAGLLMRDQWTVYGAYDVHRPLYKYAADDDAGTQWYVSSRTGEVIQVTTASERFWNWLGAVPHWLYPTLLRQHTAVWSQVVIWLTIVATFLTVFGVYVGLRQFRSRRSGRYSPYRGAALWHHYVGLVFGTLMLSWLVSGFFSMNPWGALESRSFADEIARQRGANLSLDSPLARAISSLAPTLGVGDIVRLEAHVVGGERFFVTRHRDGRRSLPGESIGTLVPFSENAVLEAAARIRPDSEVREQGWIDRDDAYYFSHHEPMPLPVYRIIYADGERFYLDALTGEIVVAVDANRRWYRWLHYALHRGDFAAFVRQRPVWDVIMLPLMLGVSLMGLTGTWIGMRRIRRSLRGKSRSGATAGRPLEPLTSVHGPLSH